MHHPEIASAHARLSGEIVAWTQLVRFCFEGCLPKFEPDPQKYLSKLPQE